MKKPEGLIYLYIPWVFDRLGGVDVIVDSLFFGMRQQGVDVRIVEQSWKKPIQWSDNEGRKFATLNSFAPCVEGGLQQRIKGVFSFIRHTYMTLRQLRAAGVTAINAHYPTRQLFMLCLLKRMHLWNGRIVLSFHGSDVNEVDEDDFIWRFVLVSADAISSCSHALRDKLIKKLGTDRYAIEVIHNGIDASGFVNQNNDLLFDFGDEAIDEYIVCLANFVEHKGQDLLVEAFAKITNKCPHITLVLAGGRDNGHWASYIKTRCAELGIEQRVVFVFDVPYERVPALLSGAKALVHASKYESFGLVIAEAGLSGTPVVAFDVGGISEIVPSADYGLLVPVGDVAALAEAIVDTFNSTALCQQRAQRLKVRVLERFSCEQMWRSSLKLISND